MRLPRVDDLQPNGGTSSPLPPYSSTPLRETPDPSKKNEKKNDTLKIEMTQTVRNLQAALDLVQNLVGESVDTAKEVKPLFKEAAKDWFTKAKQGLTSPNPEVLGKLVIFCDGDDSATVDKWAQPIFSNPDATKQSDVSAFDYLSFVINNVKQNGKRDNVSVTLCNDIRFLIKDRRPLFRVQKGGFCDFKTHSLELALYAREAVNHIFKRTDSTLEHRARMCEQFFRDLKAAALSAPGATSPPAKPSEAANARTPPPIVEAMQSSNVLGTEYPGMSDGANAFRRLGESAIGTDVGSLLLSSSNTISPVPFQDNVAPGWAPVVQPMFWDHPTHCAPSFFDERDTSLADQLGLHADGLGLSLNAY